MKTIKYFLGVLLLCELSQLTACNINNSSSSYNETAVDTSVSKNCFFKKEDIKPNNICLIEDAFIKYSGDELTEMMEQKLDTIAIFLTKNINFQIEIICYSINNPNLSTMISVKKAEAVRQYLNSKGVSNDRLLPKGYMTIDEPLNEEKKAKMKSVVFKIIKVW